MKNPLKLAHYDIAAWFWPVFVLLKFMMWRFAKNLNYSQKWRCQNQIYCWFPSEHLRWRFSSTGFWGRSCAAMRWRPCLLRWVEKSFFLYLAISCSKEMLWRKVFNFKQSSIRFVLGPPGTMASVYHFSLREACENKYDFVLRFFASHIHPSKKPLRKPRGYVMFCVI